MNVPESFTSFGRVIELNKLNKFKVLVKEPGFYELRCYFLKEKPDLYKRFYADIFTIYPKVNKK